MHENCRTVLRLEKYRNQFEQIVEEAYALITFNLNKGNYISLKVGAEFSSLIEATVAHKGCECVYKWKLTGKRMERAV